MEAQERPLAGKKTEEPEKSIARSKNTRKRSILIFVGVSLLNVGLLALLWTQLLTPSQSASQGQGSVKDPLVGQRAPVFTLAALDAKGGQKISLTDFKGKLVVLNMWSSTCAPCVDEAPVLETQWQQMKARGVVFLGVDMEDTQSDGLNFLQKYAVTYPNVIDTSGSTAVSYGVTGTPETIFINRQGVVVNAARGELTAQTLQSDLQSLLR